MDNIDKYLRADKAISSFDTDVSRGQISHAYLVTASDATTTDRALHMLAQLILCASKSACGSCSACLRIAKELHPDVRWYRSKDKIIKVDTVEMVVANSATTALESDSKLIIIPTSDRLNVAAQNKFLKTLEEPPRDVIILLGATNENMLLQTIRSRVKKLHVNIWNATNIAQELTARGYSHELINFATSLYPTSLDGALGLLSDEKHYARYQLLLSALLRLKSSANVVDCLGFLGGNADLPESLSLLETIFGGLIRDYSAGKSTPLTPLYNKTVALEAVYLCNDLSQRLEANIGSLTIENNLLFGLLELRFKHR